MIVYWYFSRNRN